MQQIVDRVLGLGDGTRVCRARPLVPRAQGGAQSSRSSASAARASCALASTASLIDLGDEIVLDRTKPHDLDVVVDRIVLKEGVKGRLTDSVELALKIGEGRLLVDTSPSGERSRCG